jgi:hypothetical protein
MNCVNTFFAPSFARLVLFYPKDAFFYTHFKIFSRSEATILLAGRIKNFIRILSESGIKQPFGMLISYSQKTRNSLTFLVFFNT